jgi:hypothetical protein
MRYLCGEHIAGIILNRPISLDVRDCLLLNVEGRGGRLHKERRGVERADENQWTGRVATDIK